jgi:hypothetical protein
LKLWDPQWCSPPFWTFPHSHLESMLSLYSCFALN